MGLRCRNPDLDEWFVLVRGLKPAYGTDRCASVTGETPEGGAGGGKTAWEQMEEQGLLEEFTEKFD